MIHSLHYFPCIHSIANLLQEKELSFDGEYPFKRSSFRNRTIIAGSTGPITLSIPVVGGRNVKLPYMEVEIDYNNHWQRDHFRTLCTAYGNSPFFQFYKDELEDLYSSKPHLLFIWNLICLKWVLKKMKISKEISEQIFEKKGLNSNNWAFEYTAQNYYQLPTQNLVKYNQVFEANIGFLPNLSVIDMLFNAGPQCNQLLLNSTNKLHSN